jgi:hypothetical protein
MTSVPNRIFLQYHGDADPVLDDRPVSEVSWSKDQVFPRDIEYVRVSTVADLVKAAKRARSVICAANANQSASPTNVLGALDAAIAKAVNS